MGWCPCGMSGLRLGGSQLEARIVPRSHSKAWDQLCRPDARSGQQHAEAARCRSGKAGFPFVALGPAGELGTGQAGHAAESALTPPRQGGRSPFRRMEGQQQRFTGA